MSLSSLGWDDFFAHAFHSFARDGLVPARVAVEHKDAYELLGAGGPCPGECAGKLRHAAITRSDLPAVGDWVAVRPRAGENRADIQAVLPRRTKFSRRAAGDQIAEQILATNVDTVFLVSALDRDFNLRRIERYLAVAWESGATPVIVLNKADLHLDPPAAVAEVAAIAAGTPVVLTSATADTTGVNSLQAWLVPGGTIALLGSSGVGKSTLLNRILGADRQRTSAVSDAVGKGRHTTTRRELVVAPSGVIVIDTPGLRELQLWDVESEAVDRTFADVTALAQQCRFRDCAHRGEPGCVVQAALESGALPVERWQSFQKLQRERAYAARQVDPEAARSHQQHWKKIHRDFRARLRHEAED